MRSRSPRVVLLGESQSQFDPVVRIVRHAIADAQFPTVIDIRELRDVMDSTTFPDLIVVLQAWPDQYSVADVNELLSCSPQSSLICCYGPWCDSDGRTRAIWPLAVRVPIASFAARFQHEIARIADSGQSPRTPNRLAAALPLTASRTEIFEFDFGRRTAALTPDVVAVVLSPDRAWREMCAGDLARRGARLVGEHQIADANLICFDTDPWDDQRASQLTLIRQAQAHARLVACAGFPEAGLEAAVHDAGADALWFKLGSLDGIS